MGKFFDYVTSRNALKAAWVRVRENGLASRHSLKLDHKLRTSNKMLIATSIEFNPAFGTESLNLILEKVF